MVIYGVCIVSKSGGLIFDYDHTVPKIETERTFSYPLGLKFVYENSRLLVSFGKRDDVKGMRYDIAVFRVTGAPNHGIRCSFTFRSILVCWKPFLFPAGHVLLAINGVPVSGRKLEDGKDALDVLDEAASYPLTLKFGRPKMTVNEKINLASMFYSIFALAPQLSPVPGSSGIKTLEADTFRLQCFQTITGIKFMAITDPTHAGLEPLLKKIYELYSDFALKNPFYSLDMPIRCELFDIHLQALLKQADRNCVNGIWPDNIICFKVNSNFLFILYTCFIHIIAFC